MKQKNTFVHAKGLFITGTDTEVGKTLVTGAIALCLRQQGRRVGVFKPVATGCYLRREGLVSTDAEFLSHCAEMDCPLSEITPARYHDPVAPMVACERSEIPIDWADITRAYANMAARNEVVLVEGIGGVYVPFERRYMVLDLMKELALPVVVVAACKLGAINHTLLTVNACRQARLKVAGVVLNGYRPDQATLAEETNARVIHECAKVPVLTVIPYDRSSSVENGRLGQAITKLIGQVDWVGLM